MVSLPNEAKRPASSKMDATSWGNPTLKLRDGTLSVSVFARSDGQKDPQVFVVPERSYKNKGGQWVSTHILHEQDLPRMALLLNSVYGLLRHDKHEAGSSQG